MVFVGYETCDKLIRTYEKVEEIKILSANILFQKSTWKLHLLKQR